MRLAICLTVLALSFPAAAAAASEVSYGMDPVEGGLGAFVVGDAEPHSISAAFDPRSADYVLRDASGIAYAGDSTISAEVAGCRQTSPRELRCLFPQGLDAGIEIHGGSSADRIDVDIPDGAQVFGNDGRDQIRGTSHRDDLNGGYGPDVLHGRGGSDWLLGDYGNDVLRGGPGGDRLGQRVDYGRDSFFGGRGADRVNAQLLAPDPDVAVDCGRGEDEGGRDREDPRSLNCERR